MPPSFASLSQVTRSRDPATDKRRVQRDLVDMISHVTMWGRTYGVQIINICPLGLMCRGDGDMSPGEKVTIWLPLVSDYPGEIRWVEDQRMGMEFITPMPQSLYQEMLALIPPRRTDW